MNKDEVFYMCPKCSRLISSVTWVNAKIRDMCPKCCTSLLSFERFVIDKGDDINTSLKLYEIIVRYNREGSVYHDDHYYLGNSPEGALKRVKKEWHKRNDLLFAEASDAEFFVKVDDHER